MKDADGNWPQWMSLGSLASAVNAVYNVITLGAGNRAEEMGRSGVTVGGVAHVVGGVAVGTAMTSGVAIAAGAAAGAAYIGVMSATTAVTVGVSLGKIGTVIENTAQKVTGYTSHGLDQKILRGVSTSKLLEAARRPLITLQQSGDKILRLTKNVGVVLNQNGKVVTAYTREQFLPHVQNIIDKVTK